MTCHVNCTYHARGHDHVCNAHREHDDHNARRGHGQSHVHDCNAHRAHGLRDRDHLAGHPTAEDLIPPPSPD